jgi:hypothetical protein
VREVLLFLPGLMASLLWIRGGGKEGGGRGPLNSNDPRNSAPPRCHLSAGTPTDRPGFGRRAPVALGPVAGKQRLSPPWCQFLSEPLQIEVGWMPVPGKSQDPQASICHASHSRESPHEPQRWGKGQAGIPGTPRYNIGQEPAPYDVIVEPSFNL